VHEYVFKKTFYTQIKFVDSNNPPPVVLNQNNQKVNKQMFTLVELELEHRCHDSDYR